MGTCRSTASPRLFARGQAIGEADCYLVTGGCPGLPLEAARGVKAVGGLVIGISSGLSLDEHIHKYGSPTAYHDVLIFQLGAAVAVIPLFRVETAARASISLAEARL